MLFDAASHYLWVSFLVRSHELSGEILIKINRLVMNGSFAVIFLYTLPFFIQRLFVP